VSHKPGTACLEAVVGWEAIAMGIGILLMHFALVLLAYEPPPMTYDLPIVLLSMV